MNGYLQFVTYHPIFSSMLQFAILGTLGEVLSQRLRGANGYPFGLYETFTKMIIWALLAISIKYAFNGFTYFVDGLAASDYLLPEMRNYERLIAEGVEVTIWNKLGFAFAVSCFMNILFAPQMMLVHRIMDNVAQRTPGNFRGLDVAFKSIIWFWIPAHTITFFLPGSYRIGLAALWSVALGAILGWASAKKVKGDSFARIAEVKL